MSLRSSLLTLGVLVAATVGHSSEVRSAEAAGDEAAGNEAAGEQEADAEPDEAADDEADSDEADSDEPDSDEPDSDEPDSDEPDSDEPDGDEPDSDEPAVSLSSEWQLGAPSSLSVGLLSGYDGRLDAPSFGERIDGGGFVFGGSADVWLSRRLSLGLTYEHRDLGGEDTGLLATGTLRTQRDLNIVWLPLRLYPLRYEHIAFYLGIGVGAVWQSVAASGVVWPRDRAALGTGFTCEGADVLSFGLRAQAGVSVPLAPGWHAEAGGRFDNIALDDAPLDGCAPGAGSVQSLGAVAQLGYTFDWSEP